MSNCAICNIHACNNSQTPENCSLASVEHDNIKNEYMEDENFKIAKQSTLCVSYDKTRLEEIIDFSRNCGYKKIGLAFCIGLAEEAKMLNKILEHNGFNVSSIICKVGNIPKDFIGAPKAAASMCNPIKQAEMLNEMKTDFNILLGLCVGHDSLFIKYSNAPITVFAVKDRVLAHNTLGAIYQAESFYKKKFFPEK